MRTATSLLIAVLTLALPVAAQIPADNVNMVSGTQWPGGDPFLQRQNEPSMAVSSRNPAHILAGANDYRTVDLPGIPGAETGDAWLGIFKSYDAGQTWTSTIHPGCPQNLPACDGAPALKKYPAAADPVVRAGTNGMFYYAGLGFTRNTPKQSAVFVSRFIDNNNEENGDPIKYLNTVPVAYGTNTFFLDKPWIAVDIPRANASTCQVSTPQKNGNPLLQSFPAGNVYLAYTTFTDETKPPSEIYFARSTDCGATWSQPMILADGSLNQGASIAVDPITGAVYVTWRRFQSTGFTDAVMFAKSTDGGQTFTPPLQVAAIQPFDQGTTTFSFRTNGYPTMAVDGTSRIYLAWTERNQSYSPAANGDARIVLVSSHDGQTWTQRAPIDDFSARGHQFMPSMAFAGGKLTIIFYDVRNDDTIGNFTSLGGGSYVETRVPAGDLATNPPHPEKVFTPYLIDAAPANLNLGGLLRRHTIDVWCAQADAADLPKFRTARVSQYIFGSRQGSNVIEQLQVNPPNLPLFQQGTAPFMGDYIDIAPAPLFLPGGQSGAWKFNVDTDRSTVFHAVWTDNRDVRPPANGDWTDYTPPISASSSSISLFDPTQPQPPCRTGQDGMRNQNIYTSRITQGLILTAPSNAKALGTLLRAFPIIMANSTGVTKSYRLTIVNQPVGGKASFLEVPVAGLPDPLTVLDVTIAPASGISRMVFVQSSVPTATVQVQVNEISAPGAASLVPGGLQGSVFLNPDSTNPANPDIANAEIFNPDIANPDIANPDIANPDIANPDIANPDIANPDIANPDIANPDIANPDIANPDIANPDTANPDIANPDIANGAMSDATWKITNTGNATAVYSLQFLLNGTLPNVIKTQLIVYRSYVTPVANGCSLVTQPHTAVETNISQAPFRTQPTAVSDITDSTIGNVTITVAPGGVAYVTLRFVNPAGGPLPFDPGQLINVVATSHAIDTGGTSPPVAATQLLIATTRVATVLAGAGYDQILAATGGKPPYTWSLLSGALPPGLTLSPAGEISGTVANSPANTYKFTVQVTDSSNSTVSRELFISVSSVGLAVTRVAAAGPNGSNVGPGDNITVTATVTNTGSPANSVIPGITIHSTGTASVTCGLPNPASAAIPTGGTQTYTFACTGVAGAGTLTFGVGLTAIDATSTFGISVGAVNSNTVTASTSSPTSQAPRVAVAAVVGGSPYTAGTWTNQTVMVTFTCTPSVGSQTVNTVPMSAEGRNQTASFTCTDSFGNHTTGRFTGIDIDKTPPMANLASPLNNFTYPLNAIVYAAYKCSDAVSGITSCTGTIASGQRINTSTAGGPFSFTVTAVDAAGNRTQVTQTYFVR
jgi:hypothetical protein